MINKRVKPSYSNLTIPKPKTSMHKEESSAYLKLQVNISKKNLLENKLRIWKAKIDALQMELEQIEKEIREIHQHIHIKTNQPMAQIMKKEKEETNEGTDKNIQVFEMEY